MSLKKRFHNPWAEEAPPAVNNLGMDVPAPTMKEHTRVFEEAEAEGKPLPRATFEVPPYGGVSVLGAGNPTEAILKLIDLFVVQRYAAEPVLTEYGIALLQLRVAPQAGFYVRRGQDGWTLAVPAAETREQALVQIIQACLDLGRNALRGQFALHHITPYRI